MTLKFGPTLFGKDTQAAYDAVLQTPEPPTAPANTPPDGSTATRTSSVSSTIDLSTYLILPGHIHGGYEYPHLLVSKTRQYQEKNWHEAHATLHAQNQYMLTVRQFVDFIDLLQNGSIRDGTGRTLPAREAQEILEDIVAIRNPWRSEWLDADFKVVNDVLHMNYQHRTANGILTPEKSEHLETCIMENTYVDLFSANIQGLPTRKSRSQETYFYQPLPDNNSVARFYAGSYRADLYCYGDPLDSDTALGVRPAFTKP